MSRARRALSWLLSPTAYATARVAAASRCRVLTGPFAGMRYPPGFVVRQLFGGPYQVGSFELEQPLRERWSLAFFVDSGNAFEGSRIDAQTGAGIGGLIGGKKGALIGAAVGGGAATIYESTKR